MEKQLWIWEWFGGGYNFHAGTKEEAIARSKQLGRFPNLVMNENTLHVGDWKEVNRFDRIYSHFVD